MHELDELLADYARLRNGENPARTAERDELTLRVRARASKMRAAIEHVLADVGDRLTGKTVLMLREALK